MQQLPTNGRHQCYWLSFLPPAGCCVCSAYRDVLSANASSLVLVLFSITLSSCLYTSGIFYFFYFYCYFLFFSVGYCRSLALPCSPCRSESNKTLTSSVTYRYRPIFSSFAINPAFFLKLANCHV